MALGKKKGPVLTSEQFGDLNALPGHWIARLGKTVVAQQSPTDVDPVALTTAIMESKADQTRTDERNIVTTELGSYSGVSLTSYKADVEAGKALAVTESLVAAGSGSQNNVDSSGNVIEYRATGLPLDIKTISKIAYEGLVPGGGSKTGYEYDPKSGLSYAVTTSVIATGSEVPTGLQTDGTYVTIRAINPVWSIKTVRKATALTTRSYTMWEKVTSLPRVLTTFSSVTFNSRTQHIPFGDEPDHKDRNYVTPSYIVLAGINTVLTDFNGEYAVTVIEAWGKDPHSLDGMTAFHPTGFSWITPFNSGSVPECLHGEVIISYSTGSNHPTLAAATGTYTFAATTPTTISGTIVLQDTQMPDSGGYLRIKKTITI